MRESTATELPAAAWRVFGKVARAAYRTATFLDDAIRILTVARSLVDAVCTEADRLIGFEDDGPDAAFARMTEGKTPPAGHDRLCTDRGECGPWCYYATSTIDEADEPDIDPPVTNGKAYPVIIDHTPCGHCGSMTAEIRRPLGTTLAPMCIDAAACKLRRAVRAEGVEL